MSVDQRNDLSEEWLPIPGFEGWYEASSYGRIRSLPRIANGPYGCLRAHPSRILGGYAHNGYRRVDLMVDGKRKSALVHRLVAAAFISPAPEGLMVCHNDGSRDNNVPGNLRYDTAEGNAGDRKLHGTEYKLRNTHCPHGHELAGENLMIRPSGRESTKRMCKTCHRMNTRRSRERAALLALLQATPASSG